MGEKDRKSQEQERNNKKISVYLKPSLLAKMDYYCDKKGYGSRSELIRRAWETHSHIFPLESHQLETKSLGEMLEENLKKLEAIELKLEMMNKQTELNINSKDLLIKRKEGVHNEIKNIPTSDIPDFNEISKILLNLIQKSGEKGIKDFVLMNEMRTNGYSESTIWLILYKLQELKKIKIEGGDWKIA